MKRSIAARIASEIVEYVPPFTSWWRAFTLSGGNRIVTRSDSDDIERPASPRFLSDVRMTSALFKHMSNRDFPGETPSGRKRRDRATRGRNTTLTAPASGCSSDYARPRPDAGPPRPGEHTCRTDRAVLS